MHGPSKRQAELNAPLRHDAQKSLLRFLTCGSVDDGKSTLIGRLLYDSKLIFEDQLLAVHRDSRKHGSLGDEIDLALLVDGLEAEREQGITIDVAYRFFSTKRRAFIVADTPGHVEYTRNMATGASAADLAVVLIDARNGVLTQTKRHSYICSLLGIRSIVLAVNKIDLVGYQGEAFYRIVADYLHFAKQLNFSSVAPIPISARYGDNVIARSERTSWYDGPTLLEYLETIDVEHGVDEKPMRLPVQWVCRPNPNFRGFAGTIASGTLAVGDSIVVAASGKQTKVDRIVTFDGDRTTASAGDAVTLTLVDEVDIARGDILAKPKDRPQIADQFAAHLLWMNEELMLPGRSYLLRIGTKTVPAQVTTLNYKVDVNTLEQRPSRTLELNDIGFVNLSTTTPVALDTYADNRTTGAFILIDRFSNETAGAGMISFAPHRSRNVQRHDQLVNKWARAALKRQTPCVLWFTGLSGSGKSTIANLVEKALNERGVHTMLLDGDNLRHGLNRDLGFTEPDRVEDVRRVGEVAKLFTEAGLVVISCFISPFRAEREMVKDLVGASEFAEVFVDVPIEECIRRDPKGLYRKAMAGRIKNFTGIDSSYEAPGAPDILIRGQDVSAEEAAEHILQWVLDYQARRV